MMPSRTRYLAGVVSSTRGGTATSSLDRERDRLKIQVPGTPHVLSAEASELPMNAPRIVRRVRGDFTAGVRVLGRLEPGRSRTTHYDPFHGAGLIVWQDPSNYLRLERAVGCIQGRRHPYINYELREGGRLAMSHGITIEDHSLFLKLRREGRVFSAWYSRDGRRWNRLASVETTLAERVEVGVVAVNSSGRDAVGRAGEVRHRRPSGLDGPRLCGRRLGKAVDPSSDIGGDRSGAGGIPVMPGAGRVSDPWLCPGFGSPVIIRPRPRLIEARPV